MFIDGVVVIRACTEAPDRDWTLSCFHAKSLHPGEDWRDTAGNSIQISTRKLPIDVGTSVVTKHTALGVQYSPHHLLGKPVGASAVRCFPVQLQRVTCQVVLLVVATLWPAFVRLGTWWRRFAF